MLELFGLEFFGPELFGEAIAPSDLPPCGGDARQGRGGCHTAHPLFPRKAPSLKTAATDRPESGSPAYPPHPASRPDVPSKLTGKGREG
ncbi:hypothetical protein EFR84_17175 [Rhizobium chutanense]|uniref:Uncharacterized protein n=1 Tax=Rhizobium chutanense TaxID=2035448 RepID=A0A3S0SGD7_9HYPH|nr:hypothetical protein EFR84_17175 [Rhizobium chutanense]